MIFPAWLGPEQAGCQIKPRGRLIQFLGLNHNSLAARIRQCTFNSTVPLGTHAEVLEKEKEKEKGK
jgi:hypothetical protein